MRDQMLIQSRVLQGLCTNTSFFLSNHQLEAMPMNNLYHLIIIVQLKFRAAEPCYQLGGHLCMGVSKWPLDISIPGQIPNLNLLPQGKQGHISPASAEADAVPQRSLVNIEVEANYGGQPVTAMESPFMPRVIHDEERLERKRKSEEARIAREVEAHDKGIRKELEKQDMLRKKRRANKERYGETGQGKAERGRETAPLKAAGRREIPA